MAQYKRSTQRKFRKNTQKKKINKRKTKGRKPIRRKSINRKKIGSGVHSDVSDDVTKNLLNEYSRAMTYYVSGNMDISYGILKKMADDKCTFFESVIVNRCKSSCKSLPQDNQTNCEKNKAKIYYLAFTLLTLKYEDTGEEKKPPIYILIEKSMEEKLEEKYEKYEGLKKKLKDVKVKLEKKGILRDSAEFVDEDERTQVSFEEKNTVFTDIGDYKDAYDAITNDPHYYLEEGSKEEDKHIGLERLILDVFESDPQYFRKYIEKEKRDKRKSRKTTLEKFVENKGMRREESYLNKRKMMYNNLKTVYSTRNHWFILGDEEQSKIRKDRHNMVNNIDFYKEKKEEERKKTEEEKRLNTKEKLEERLDNFSALPFDRGDKENL